MHGFVNIKFVQTCNGKSHKDELATTGVVCLEFFVFYLFSSKNHRLCPTASKAFIIWIILVLGYAVTQLVDALRYNL
jgi:hypothetical protein